MGTKSWRGARILEQFRARIVFERMALKNLARIVGGTFLHMKAALLPPSKDQTNSWLQSYDDYFNPTVVQLQ
jgi:hypothetical protein